MDVQSKSSSRVDDLEIVVDTDLHVTESQDDFLPYLEDPFKKLIDRHVEGAEIYGSQSYYPSAGYFSPHVLGKARVNTVRTKADIQKAKQDMRIDSALVTPTLNLYLAAVQHDDLSAALASAYNRWMLDEFADRTEGIYGSVLVSPQKPRAAADEIDDFADEPDIAAVMFPSAAANPPLGHEWYYPIYDAAEKNDLPILMHNASGAGMMSFPIQFQGFNRLLSSHATIHTIEHMTNITDMMTRGVFEQYADVDFVFQEGGIGWVPYMMRRLDHEYSAKREDAPMLQKMPSEYIRDQIYFTSQPIEGHGDPEYVSKELELMDAENNLLLSTDYPHFDFDHAGELRRHLQGFTDEAVERIYGQTAVEVFDL